MAKGFDHVTMSYEDIRKLKTDSGVRSGIAVGSSNAEQVAREFLKELVANDSRPSLRSVDVGLAATEVAPSAAGPQLVKRGERTEDITETEVVSFAQQKNDIPVFGSRAVVEMDQQREVVSASLDVADVEGVDTDPSVSAEQAREYLAGKLGASEIGTVPEPAVTILPHPHEEGALHLAWHFQHVPLEPPAEENAPPEQDAENVDLGGCTAHGPMLRPDFDYFVDAHTGKLIYLFPNSAHLDIPTRCRGEDVDGQNQVFFGRLDGAEFKMENPFEDIRTLDLGLQPIETTPLPTEAVENATSDWQNTNPAAVSAHVNATRVLDFLFRILRRNSIDDNGMVLENIVNCSSNSAPNPPEWINAVWWQGKMWYGQQSQGGGNFSSLSRFLDVIAHELFHGITEHTADLVYESLPGALNESFSDIFGIIVRNWHLAPAPGDVSTWSWEIGPGLGSGGDPLRHMANPASVGRWRRPHPSGSGFEIVNGYPDHMNDYVPLPVTRFYDWGGVHWFSSIHNLAAHNVLTSQRPDNTFVFSPEEVAILYYLVLTRLDRLSEFDDTRAEMLLVSDVIYAGNLSRANEARDAITQAYDAVGIV